MAVCCSAAGCCVRRVSIIKERRKRPNKALFETEREMQICVTRWVSKVLVWMGTGSSDLMSARCTLLFSCVCLEMEN